MSTAAATVEGIAAKLSELSKNEVIQELAKLKAKGDQFKSQHKGMVKRVLMVAAQTTVAVGAGATAGLLELKMPTIPKTRLRIDLVTSSLLAAANLFGWTDELQPIVQSAADSLTGHGVGRVTEAFAEKRLGIKRTARPELHPRTPRVSEVHEREEVHANAKKNGAQRAAA